MEIDKMLKHVTNLNEYVTVSQTIIAMPVNSKIQFNMSTVLSLKKVRALEIEYFNKCEGSGGALLIFERMVKLPPSKKWILLGKELVLLLQYWLDAMRKHLIKHNHNWWNFMKQILNFIQLIRCKDPLLPNILVEYIAESLLDLATGSEPAMLQRLEILVCLNLCCRDSSRDTRKSLKKPLEPYFVKLSSLLSSCGHWPTQYAIVETLMRWLVARHDPRVRQEAVSQWYPVEAYGSKAIELFMSRDFQNFYQDARDFLNALNEISDRVCSVVCRKAIIGNVVIATTTDRREAWLDINISDMSISVFVEPRVVDALGCSTETLETLILTDDNIQHVTITKESSEVILSVYLLHTPHLVPCGAELDGYEMNAVVPSKHVERLDSVLRNIYKHRYKLLLDICKLTLSPQDFEKMTGCMEEDARFSHPIEKQKRKHSGYVVRSRNPDVWKSPSTASTSSLAQLHEKLVQLPRFNFDKEAVHVCALPELSTVTEVSETDERQSLASVTTVKINRPFGVCQKSVTKEKKSQSDGELQNKSKIGRYLSPVPNVDENSTSCLLVATIGSDESVINETIERFNKSKEFQGDNIVDLLVKEALQIDYKDKLLDSGINTGDNRKTQEQENNEQIENTLVENNKTDQINKIGREKTCTVISNTTTDESNDVVYDTPLNFVNIRKGQKEGKENKATIDIPNNRPVFDVQAVEKFFTEHLNENQRGELMISPTLAKKINESSSDSEPFDECLMNKDNDIHTDQIEIQDIDIVECLNFIVNKVCNDFEKCSEILNKEFNNLELLHEKEIEINSKKYIPLKDSTNINKKPGITDKTLSEDAPKKALKLKYPTKGPVRTRTNLKKKKALETKVVSKMSLITETKGATEDIAEEVTGNEPKDSPATRSDYLDLPLIRRKRKLYSPKDGNVKNKTPLEEDKDFKAAKKISPHYKSTSYKDIEEDRQRNLKTRRSRRSSSKSERPLSPRTKKMNDIFDHLKDKIDSNDSVILADKNKEKDLAIYNFTSDSEDEDFKKKKIEVQKRVSITTIASGDSLMTRRGRTTKKVIYSEGSPFYSSEESNKPIKKSKRTRRKKQTNVHIKKEKSLLDEKMRKNACEELNTSLVIEKPLPKDHVEPDLILTNPPEMEIIPDEQTVETKKHLKKLKKTEALSLKRDKSKSKTTKKEIAVDDGKESPLPGLVVETIIDNQNDNNDSMSVNMIQKLKKIYQEETSINDTNTTQNLLSDFEKIVNSPPPMNISDEFNKLETETIDITDVTVKRISNTTIPEIEDSNIAFKKTKSPVLRSSRRKKKDARASQRNKDADEIIEISCISDSKSIKSIETVGDNLITAHGDSNEAPPNSKLLRQHYEHRDVEIEDLDQSIKDYFNTLRNEATISSANKHKSDSSNDNLVISKEMESSPKTKSPVVSISRLSIDDISKWLPSRQNSDTDTSYTTAKPKKKASDIPKSINSKKSSTKSTSPTEILNQIVSEINSPKEVNSPNKSKLERSRNKPKVFYREDSDSDNEKDLVSVNKARSRSIKNLRIESKIKNKEDSPLKETIWLHSHNEPGPSKKRLDNVESTYRKSIISPVKMFDDVLLSIAHDFSEEQYKRSPKISVMKEKDSKLDRHHSKELKSDKEKIESSSPVSKISTSTRLDTPDNILKRKSYSTEVENVKRRLLDSTVLLSESEKTASSVSEWFRRIRPMTRAEVNASFTEPIHNVLEKLDTTLAEIHQNTSKKFIHMFVDAQKHLASVKQERRQMFRTVAADILAEVAKVVDAKFADLDERSQQMDKEFIHNLKSQALELIREDCNKKQVMVTLLKEDIQAVLDHMNKVQRDD